MARRMGRRAFLVGGLGLAVSTALGGAGVASGVIPMPGRIRQRLEDQGPAGVIPADPEGQLRLERVSSAARGRQVGLFSAVPHGHGDGNGLPVCLVLHGASATTADYQRFGLARFLTSAVRGGTPPFVLVGADGGRSSWEGDGAGDDPQLMLREELPRWCADRGYDSSRLAAYGWSMGGYGALRLAQATADLRAVAALSPAVRDGDAVMSAAGGMDGRRVALWCGRSDALLPDVQQLADRIADPAIASWDKGGHTRRYWNRITPDAFGFVGRALAKQG